MCGICGYSVKRGSADRGILTEMNATLRLRGPDSSGIHIEGSTGIAACRLAIMDVEGGAQPFSNETRTIHVVCNGEIYNYQQLKKTLRDAGHVFKTHCDTECIVHAYEEWGRDLALHLNGMFAIAVHDVPRREILLFRDRLGIKPLYYFKNDALFAFGSEIKALLKHPDVPRDLSMDSLCRYLRYRFVPNPETVYREIKMLEPGSRLAVSTEQNQILENERYWHAHVGTPIQSYEECVEKLDYTLSKSIQQRMMSDVPLGAFLSGGIDSSLIVGKMSEYSSRPIRTFSVGFEEASFDELPHAREIARKFRTDHTELMVRTTDALDVIRSMLSAFDQPHGNSGAIPYYHVCRETSRHLTVALSGLGADELFIGYERYLIHYYNRFMRYLPAQGLKAALSRLPVTAHQKGILRRIKTYIHTWEDNDDDHFSSLVTVHPPSVIRPGKPLEEESIFHKQLQKADTEDFYDRAAFSDLNTILTDDYLAVADRLSMAVSLEVRVPFLDHELVELALRIPSRFRHRGALTKYILRDAYEGFLSRDVVRRKKHGFEVPVASWIRNELRKEIHYYIFEVKSDLRSLVDTHYLQKIYEDHCRGRFDYSRQLFSIFMLIFWEVEMFSGAVQGE